MTFRVTYKGEKKREKKQQLTKPKRDLCTRASSIRVLVIGKLRSGQDGSHGHNAQAGQPGLAGRTAGPSTYHHRDLLRQLSESLAALSSKFVTSEVGES